MLAWPGGLAGGTAPPVLMPPPAAGTMCLLRSAPLGALPVGLQSFSSCCVSPPHISLFLPPPSLSVQHISLFLAIPYPVSFWAAAVQCRRCCALPACFVGSPLHAALWPVVVPSMPPVPSRLHLAALLLVWVQGAASNSAHSALPVFLCQYDAVHEHRQSWGCSANVCCASLLTAHPVSSLKAVLPVHSSSLCLCFMQRSPGAAHLTFFSLPCLHSPTCA